MFLPEKFFFSFIVFTLSHALEVLQDDYLLRDL